MKNMREPVSVYLIYGVDGALLYVGCTGNAKKRLVWHRTCSDWYDEDLCLVRRHVYQKREVGLAVEARAISILKPLHNRKGRPENSRRNWNLPGYSGFDVEAANALREHDF